MKTQTTPGRVVLCVVTGFSLVFLPSCGHGGSDNGGSGLRISLASTPPSGGSDVVWIAEGGRTGDLLLVDVVSRDISSEFDGFNLEILFDPLVASAQSVSSGGILDGCAPGQVLKVDNVANHNADQTGSILISEAITGSSPPGCTASGLRTISRVTLRARGRGSSTLPFVPYNGDPSAPSGSRFYRTQPSVPDVPVQFFDSGALVEVTR